MKKKSILCVLTGLVLLSLLAGCSSIYLPNVPATPMLREQGETYVAGHVNLKGYLSGSLAVAATDRIAILGNGSYVDQGFHSNTYFKQWLAEGAVGYSTKLGAKKNRVFEIYGGYGIGHALQQDKRATTQGYESVESREMGFHKIFIQANYSSKRDRKINLLGDQRELSFGTAIRMSRIAMNSFQLDGIGHPKEENILIEPVFYTRLQLINGLQLQYTSGFNIGLHKNEYLKAGNSVLTLGLVYNFGKK
ncbi:MAG TPA: hypothetical protein PKA53_03225 [Sphingobacterium sp.]|nr:hypothetical protein [Sphingobacterium sp.]